MADTMRSKSTLLDSLFQDGQIAGISAQDMRDLIVSLAPDFGGLYWTTPAETSVTVAGTYVKAAGTTTVSTISANMSLDAVNNRLKYTGVSPRHFHIVLQVSATLASGSNQDIGIQVWRYDASAATGALVAHSEASTTIGGTAVEQITSHSDVTLDTNDYIELHITNKGGTPNPQVELGYVFAVSMVM